MTSNEGLFCLTHFVTFSGDIEREKWPEIGSL